VSVFDQAKKAITSGLIEAMFPGGEWRTDGDYWVCSPLRADNKIGSFHISADGLWKDFSTDEGGSFIDLVAASMRCKPSEAAEEIVKRSGGIPEGKAGKSEGKKKKPAPIIPIPDSAKESLNVEIKGDYAKRTHGTVAAGWRYHTADGGWAFAVVRYNKPDGSKDVIPYYWGTDSRWHEGQAYANGRPLYNLPALAKADRILVVEGEKCASVEVPGWTLTTWSAGASSVAKTDWAPLAEAAAAGRVLVWPDADEAGIRAARTIFGRLPGARILDVQGKPSGWDIADAAAEGIELAAWIDFCPVLDASVATEAPDAETRQFFRCLGYDAERYWFLREGKRAPQSIGFGSWTTSKVQELAPLAWWGVHGMVGDQGGIKLAIAQDYITGIQDQVGRYDPDILRGAGVWRDEDEIIVNDGRRIAKQDGTPVAYADFPSRYCYLASDVVFGDLAGREATEAEGCDLVELFETQGWARPAYALAALGWALIAPFGGILRWRPHIWVSGRRGTGKSYVLENLIATLLGDFAYRGSGKDSEAGIRRSLRTDARPAVFDEMEPLDKRSADRVASILTLARNASSDASGFITIAGADGGTLQFRIRSCFCFASVQTADLGAAIDSRIIKCELKWMVREQMEAKKARTAELVARIMRDPGIFRRRIFRSLERIISDIELLRGGMLDAIGDQRAADQWAPILAACWALVAKEPVNTLDGRAWVANFIKEIAASGEDSVEDEDRVIGHILSAQIESDGKVRRTIAELLAIATNPAAPNFAETGQLLARYGIKIVMRRNAGPALAIATRSDALIHILRDTPYAIGYDAQIKRHPLCITPQGAENAYIGGQMVKARFLAWDEFKAAYLGKGDEE
jgi:putative DNA primase/helicase